MTLRQKIPKLGSAYGAEKAAAALKHKLRVSRVYFNAETGTMPEIESKDELTSGMALAKTEIVFGSKTLGYE